MNGSVYAHSWIDIGVFLVYFLGLLTIGFLSARRRSQSRDYFLAGRTLPWYVIGCSMIAANISGEQLIGMVGQSYTHGLVVANWSWLNVFAYSLLIFVFLPYYLKCGFFTMPEFLERRYGPGARIIFAAVTIVIDIVGFLGPTLYIGALALGNFFDLNPYWTILILAVVAGSYAIYGGLLSVAWTDVLQCAIIYAGGLVLGIRSVMAAGGLQTMMAAAPEKYHVIHGPSDPIPFLGLLFLLPSASVWYNCTNQFILQRCLAARSEWDARMGVVWAGFLQVIMPLFVVVPGLAAAVILRPDEISRPDDTYVTMVRLLIPVGFRGLIVAALVGAIVSTVSSLINSTGTIATVDFYQRFFGADDADDKRVVRVGRLTGVGVLVLGTGMAMWLVGHQGHVFAFIQNMFAHVAPPFAAIFLLGIFWSRPTARAALLTIAVGLCCSLLAEYAIIPGVIYRGRSTVPEFVFLYRLGAVWGICVVTLIAASLIAPGERHQEQVTVEIWSPRYLRLPREELAPHRGWRDFRFWWVLYVATVVGLLIYFA